MPAYLRLFLASVSLSMKDLVGGRFGGEIRKENCEEIEKRPRKETQEIGNRIDKKKKRIDTNQITYLLV